MGRNRRLREEAGAAAAAGPSDSWYAAKGPALRFVLISGAFMLFFYGVFYTSPEESPAVDAFIRRYLELYASAAASVLGLVGYDAHASGTTIQLAGRGVDVVRGCDAMEPIALFVAAVIAMRTSLGSKAIGVLVGLPILALVNLLRIVGLTIVSVDFADHFETAHVTVAQTLFVVCTLCLWFAWVLWARKREARGSPVGPG